MTDGASSLRAQLDTFIACASKTHTRQGENHLSRRNSRTSGFGVSMKSGKKSALNDGSTNSSFGLPLACQVCSATKEYIFQENFEAQTSLPRQRIA